LLHHESLVDPRDEMYNGIGIGPRKTARSMMSFIFELQTADFCLRASTVREGVCDRAAVANPPSLARALWRKSTVNERVIWFPRYQDAGSLNKETPGPKQEEPPRVVRTRVIIEAIDNTRQSLPDTSQSVYFGCGINISHSCP
jgi:hypothetical protein